MAGNVKCDPAARSNPVWIALALAVVTLAVYCPVAGFQFINFDDTGYVTENPHVRAGLTLEGFQWALGSQVVGNWHPITMFSHMLDCQLFGVKPWWPHLVNALLHAANTVLLFGLLKRMTGALWRSAVVAALFALHPLHVESVAWVSERKDVLSTLFWLLTIWAYVRYAEECKVQNAKCRIFYGLSLVFFAIGLMSKPMLVTLPFTLLLLDYWPLGRRAAWEKIPYFAMSAVMCVVTLDVQKQSGAMPRLESFPPGERVVNALMSYGRYIGKMFWPRDLCGLYVPRLGQWRWWEAALAALALLAVTAVAVAQRGRRPYLATGWFWYVGTLVPVIGLVQVGRQAMADRYTYVPLIGLFVILAWGGWELAGGWRLGRLAPAAAVAALGACAALTVHQEFYWKNSEAYNQRMIDVMPDNFFARKNLGLVYLEESRTNEALSNFMASAQENPNYPDAHNHIGAVLAGKGQMEEAIRQYREAIRLKPDYAQAHYNLGMALDSKGQIEEAIREYQEAIRLKPELAEAHDNLGMSLDRKGQKEEAMAQFREAIRLKPELAEAHNNLGAALGAKGQMDEAIREYQEAIRLKPEVAEEHNNLGMSLGRKGQLDEAIGQFREAIRLKPEWAEAHNNLGTALGVQGQIGEAIRQFQEAIRLKPDMAEARDNLARAMRMKEAPAGR